MDDDPRIGVALSGGGHRATVFGLGALLALIDSRLNGHVVSISSVSGGSVANGIALVGPDYARSSAAELEGHYRPALKVIADRGLLLGGAPATRGYVRTLIGALAVATIAVLATVVMLVTHLWIPALVDAELLGDDLVTLDDERVTSSSVHHVICTTELHTGTPFYFTNRAVYGHQFGGTTDAAKLPIATAVQASACVPGAFAPRVIARSALRLPGEGDIVAVDGGVYDNMADEWEYGFQTRVKSWPGLVDVQHDSARLLVVVNGSAGWDTFKPIKRGRLAIELAGLMRSMNVQYDVSTAHRRRALLDRFRDDDDTRLDKGIFVQISASPFDAPTRFAGSEGRPRDAFAERAEKAEKFLRDSGYTPEWWDATVEETSGTKTTLAKLGVDLTAKLLEHAYVLCRVNLYVIAGLGDLNEPVDRDRFKRLARGDPAA
jgi:predicted acylesterase/phospholipase RssA